MRDLRTAVQSLTPIAEAVGGNYDQAILDSSKKDSLSKELEKRTSESLQAFDKASKSADTTVTSAMHTDGEVSHLQLDLAIATSANLGIQIANLRDAVVLGHPNGIQDATVNFNADLKTWIDSTNAVVVPFPFVPAMWM